MKIFKKIISFVVFCSLIFTSFSGVFATESKSLDFQKKIEELKDYKLMFQKLKMLLKKKMLMHLRKKFKMR